MIIGAVLAATLTFAPGIGLSDSGPERAVQLVQAPLANLETMTKQQLENELLRLQTTRPRLLAPIVFISVGAVAALGGLVLLNLGSAVVFSKPALLGTFLLAGGAILLLGGAVIAIIGLVKIGRLLSERKAIGVETELIEKRLDTLDRLSQHDWVSMNELLTF